MIIMIAKLNRRGGCNQKNKVIVVRILIAIVIIYIYQVSNYRFPNYPFFLGVVFLIFWVKTRKN